LNSIAISTKRVLLGVGWPSCAGHRGPRRHLRAALFGERPKIAKRAGCLSDRVRRRFKCRFRSSKPPYQIGNPPRSRQGDPTLTEAAFGFGLAGLEDLPAHLAAAICRCQRLLGAGPSVCLLRWFGTNST
jgi:hypothetical protein